jgi:hypothetical protein
MYKMTFQDQENKLPQCMQTEDFEIVLSAVRLASIFNEFFTLQCE